MKSPAQQSNAEWLQAYNTPQDAVRQALRPKRATPAPTTALPTKKPTKGITQPTNEWLSDYQSAQEEKQRLCLDITNTLDTKYLPAECLKHGDSKIVRSQHGTGKSTAVRALINDHMMSGKSVLIICAGVQQAIAEQKKNPGFEIYSKMAPGEIVANHTVICIDSIQRVKRRFDLIIVDECEQIAAAPLKHNLHAVKGNPQGRIHLFHHLASLLYKAGKVVMLDADAGHLTDTLCAYAGLDPLTVENKYNSLDTASVELVKSRGAFLQAFEDAEGAHLYCAAPADATAQHRKRKKKATLIIGKSAKNKTQFIDQVSTGQHFSGDLITTTALRSGVSIDEGKHDIKTVFAWIKVGDGYPPLSDQVQAMRRARGVKQFVIYIETGALKAPLTTDPDQIRKDLERAAELNTKHVNQFLISNPQDGVRLDEMTTDLYCLHKAEINRQRNDPAAWITERFKQLGATVEINDTEKPLLDRIQREKTKQAAQLVKNEATEHATTAPIPETIDDCANDVDRALFTARHVLNLPEPLAREAARRDIAKTGFIKSMQRCAKESRPQSELIKEDFKKLTSGDPIARCSAKVAAMNQEVIGICGHLFDGFTKEDTDSILMPWLIRNASDYGKLTGSRFVCPEDIKSAGFLKKALERYGITVTSGKSNGSRVYSVDRNDDLNRRAIEQLTGTNCFNNIYNDSLPLAAVA